MTVPFASSSSRATVSRDLHAFHAAVMVAPNGASTFALRRLALVHPERLRRSVREMAIFWPSWL